MIGWLVALILYVLGWSQARDFVTIGQGTGLISRSDPGVRVIVAALWPVVVVMRRYDGWRGRAR